MCSCLINHDWLCDPRYLNNCMFFNKKQYLLRGGNIWSVFFLAFFIRFNVDYFNILIVNSCGLGHFFVNNSEGYLNELFKLPYISKII